jgi:hypothetical protein
MCLIFNFISQVASIADESNLGNRIELDVTGGVVILDVNYYIEWSWK